MDEKSGGQASPSQPGQTNATRPRDLEPQKLLDHVAPQIEEIRLLFGAPSISVGVIRRHKRAFRSFGHSNVGKQQKPDEETIYGVGSCTKAFTSTIIARLHLHGKLHLDKPVSDHLPELSTVSSPTVAQTMTTRQMLSHCSGLSQLIYEVIGKNGKVFTHYQHIIQIFNNLPKVARFGTEWQYNNWLFALAGVLITRITGQTFGTIVKNQIFTKLGMNRSYFEIPRDDNVAIPYLVLDDGPPISKELPSFGDGDAFDSSGSMRSCIKDMLTWTESLMDSRNTSNGSLSVLSGFFPRWISNMFWSAGSLPADIQYSLAEIQKPSFPLDDDNKQKYGMGLYTLQLPTTAMNTVTNSGIIPEYILGQDSEPKVAIGHTGEFGGFLSVYWSFPEHETAIVVLANSFETNGDPTNIIAQVVAQKIFNLQPQVELTPIAEKIVANAKTRWINLQTEWSSHRAAGTHPEKLHSYTGRYTNKGLAMVLSVSYKESDTLKPIRLEVNDDPEQVFDLHHYHKNSWTFFPETRDDMISQGYSSYVSSWQSFVLDFEAPHGEKGEFQTVKWKLDPDSRVEQTSFTREY